MKQLFEAFTIYNKNTNRIIGDYILNMSIEQFENNTKTFFPTIILNILHVMESDLKWLYRLKEFNNPEVRQTEISELTGDKDLGILFQNQHKIIELRCRLDRDIISLISSIDDFSSEIEIDFGGNKIIQFTWKLILQWFNHQTHHRGQISVLLDIQGINNDFSMMLDKI